MRKYLIILLLFISIAFTGCGDTINQRAREAHSSQISIYVDEETGVNYISDLYSGGITVRVNADGSPYVSEEVTR